MDNIFRFANFEADRERYQLWKETHPVKLERIPLDLLFLLLENRGKLVSREQIVAKLWGSDLFLDTDRSINTAVRKVRRALGDDPHHPQFVETVVGRGYRFIASAASENQSHNLQHAIHSAFEQAVRFQGLPDTTILLRDFLVESATGSTVLTCDVFVSNVSLGRVKLLDFELPSDLTLPLKPQDRLMLNLHGARVSLTENAARALQSFSVAILQRELRTRTTDSFRLNEQARKDVSLHLATQAVIGEQP